MSVERLFGRVKWFNAKQGYGFITDCKSSNDVFVHHSGLVAPENVYKTLREGEYVEYATKQDETGKTVAMDVTGINRGPLGCEAMAKRFAERKARVASRKQEQPATVSEGAATSAPAQVPKEEDGFTKVGRPTSSRGSRRGGRGGSRGGSTRQYSQRPAVDQQERTFRKPEANSYAGKLASKEAEKKQ